MPRDRKGAFLLLTLATLKVAIAQRGREIEANGSVNVVLRSACQHKTQGKKKKKMGVV